MNTKSTQALCSQNRHPKNLFIKILLITFISILFIIINNASAQRHATVKGYVVWDYNQYRKNEPDTGAKVYLFKHDKKKISWKDIILDHRSIDKIYYTQVGPDGRYTINNLVPGQYNMLIVSENTKRDIFIDFAHNINYYEKLKNLKCNIKDENFDECLHTSVHYSIFSSFQRHILGKHINEDHDGTHSMLTRSNKYRVIDDFELQSGETKEYNFNFGYTHF